jgi:hypothetical protein
MRVLSAFQPILDVLNPIEAGVKKILKPVEVVAVCIFLCPLSSPPPCDLPPLCLISPLNTTAQYLTARVQKWISWMWDNTVGRLEAFIMSITGLDKLISHVEEKIKSTIAEATGLDELPKKVAEILDGSILKLAEGLADFGAIETVVQVRTTFFELRFFQSASTHRHCGLYGL